MFEHGFINLIYVSNNFRELEMLPKEIKEATTQKDNKGKTSIFCQIPHYLLGFYNNKWYLAQHMIQVGISSSVINPTIDLDQVSNDYDFELFELKVLTSNWAIEMKVLYEQLERISKEKVCLHQVTSEYIVFFISRKENIAAKQANV